MSGRLKLRRGVIVAERPLTVEVDGEARPAWADIGLLGKMREGDEVVVNVAALDLKLGSGGFDVVHVNLTRGLEEARASAEGSEETVGGPASEPHVMKLNYTSLQHPVEPVERPTADATPMRRTGGGMGPTSAVREVPVLVLPLHGHLAPAAWALAQAGSAVAGGEDSPKPSGDGASRVGYVQTGGGALPGALSRDVAELRERGLLCGHITVAPAYGGEQEAISLVGALDAAVSRLAWDAVLVGPGPGILGSATDFGHGGIAALDSAHAALALGLPTILSPRLSSSDPRERHRGLSHHTATVLDCLLAPVEVAAPAPDGLTHTGAAGIPGAAEALDALRAAAAPGSHRLLQAEIDLEGYAASGLPARTMGRSLDEDPLFFAAPLAAGATLAARSISAATR